VETHLKCKTGVVTEALRNFGTPMALAFAREGANLFLATMSDHEPLTHISSAVASLGVKVVTELCDLSREAQVEAAVHKCMAELGRVDVVVNNVLFPVPAHAFGAVPFEVWEREIEVELTGSFAVSGAPNRHGFTPCPTSRHPRPDVPRANGRILPVSPNIPTPAMFPLRRAGNPPLAPRSRPETGC
jgi:NAD(P)-dependent dehydrogenase (short-subunit alcohol dehydrogenase family)